MQETAAPKCVETAAIDFVVLACLPLAGREVEMLPIASWLVRFDALAAEFLFDQQIRDLQRGVTNELSVDAPAALTGHTIDCRDRLRAVQGIRSTPVGRRQT